MRRGATVALVAVALWIACGLRARSRPPSPPLALGPAEEDEAGAYRGALHVHTVRSDGRGDDADVARAAKAAGLDFAIVTDHNVAPLAPAYVDGVLLARGVELSTPDGHLLVLGAAGEPTKSERENGAVRWAAQHGGVTVAAHPTNRKRAWTQWPLAPGVAGLEILSGDSLFTDALAPPWLALAKAAAAWPFARDAALFSLYERPDAALRRFDETAAHRHVVAECGCDAHGLPPYRDVFGQFVVHVARGAWAPTGDAAADALTLVDAIAAGATSCAVEELGDARGFSFEARRTDGVAAQLGGALDAPATLAVRLRYAAVPTDAALVLLRDGREVARAAGPSAEFTASEPGEYRIEVWRRAPALYVGERDVPWIYSNPIWVR